ncbi:SGNH/GDSL hydrolase family protein [Streptomyces sp. A7024]|uniref:SGNH/GDSL hydrolase family protein n=1 Tax=Streptomyces coryli TaxID=1128680 RepID=A0A6G4TV70_9ACTN|nr:SGNH/GDSL hydrolase family protein [Streptomyces coryli]NGN62891.1 SGNH/GDSL hydrolase family protein [Streptomyces coryli]
MRFAVLGDSLSEGVGDPAPGGGWRGWCELLAGALAADRPVRVIKVARSGALSTDVAYRQLPAALAERPQLASVMAGGNDTLRAGFDIHRTVAALDHTMGALTESGARLLTACLPDAGRALGLPWPLARPLARRMDAVNTAVHALSERYDALHLHLAVHPCTAERGARSVDRLHPSELGHRVLARAFHAELVGAGLAAGAPPGADPETPAPSVLDGARWLAFEGTRWVAQRCTDLLPGLLGLAVAESRYWLLRREHELEERARGATLAALSAPAARMAA